MKKTVTWIEFLLSLVIFISIFFILIDRYYLFKSENQIKLKILQKTIDTAALGFYILNSRDIRQFYVSMPYLIENVTINSTCLNCLSIGFNNSDLIIVQNVSNPVNSYLELGLLEFGNINSSPNSQVICYEEYYGKICKVKILGKDKITISNISQTFVVLYDISTNIPIYIGNKKYLPKSYTPNIILYRRDQNVVEKVYI